MHLVIQRNDKNEKRFIIGNKFGDNKLLPGPMRLCVPGHTATLDSKTGGWLRPLRFSAKTSSRYLAPGLRPCTVKCGVGPRRACRGGPRGGWSLMAPGSWLSCSSGRTSKTKCWAKPPSSPGEHTTSNAAVIESLRTTQEPGGWGVPVKRQIVHPTLNDLMTI